MWRCWPRSWTTTPNGSNVYNRVEVLLATHDSDGVTALDLQMARFMDEAAAALG